MCCWFLQKTCSVSKLSERLGVSADIIKKFMAFYDLAQKDSKDLEKTTVRPEKEVEAVAAQESVDGQLTRRQAGRFIVTRGGFDFDAEEVRVLKARRNKTRR